MSATHGTPVGAARPDRRGQRRLHVAYGVLFSLTDGEHRRAVLEPVRVQLDRLPAAVRGRWRWRSASCARSTRPRTGPTACRAATPARGCRPCWSWCCSSPRSSSSCGTRAAEFDARTFWLIVAGWWRRSSCRRSSWAGPAVEAPSEHPAARRAGGTRGARGLRAEGRPRRTPSTRSYHAADEPAVSGMTTVLTSTPQRRRLPDAGRVGAACGCWMVWPERPTTGGWAASPPRPRSAAVAEAIAEHEPVTWWSPRPQYVNAREHLPGRHPGGRDDHRTTPGCATPARRSSSTTPVSCAACPGGSTPGAAWRAGCTSRGTTTTWSARRCSTWSGVPHVPARLRPRGRVDRRRRPGHGAHHARSACSTPTATRN